MTRARFAIGLVAIPALVVLAVAAGSTAVGPGEVVVVRRLGRALPGGWGPGWHWTLPFGLDRTTRLRVDEVRRLEFGGSGDPGPLDAPGLGEYLTGDANLLRARGVVQYRVADPARFVLRAADRDGLLERTTEASVARALASRGVDGPMLGDRTFVGREIADHLSGLVGDLGLGIEVLGVSLAEVRPPVEVAPAFADAQAARSVRDRRIAEGSAIAATLRPAAIASAGRAIDGARARADRSRALAEAQASRFLGLLAEAERDRPLTVRRLYRDTLRDLLPRVRRKVWMSPGDPVDLGLFGEGPR